MLHELVLHFFGLQSQVQLYSAAEVTLSYGLGVEAVKEPFGSTLGAPVPLAVWKQREQSMTGVAGVLGDWSLR